MCVLPGILFDLASIAEVRTLGIRVSWPQDSQSSQGSDQQKKRDLAQIFHGSRSTKKDRAQGPGSVVWWAVQQQIDFFLGQWNVDRLHLWLIVNVHLVFEGLGRVVGVSVAHEQADNDQSVVPAA